MAVMNRRLLLTPLLLVAGLLSACDGDGVRITTSTSDSGDKGVLKVVDALQCPESEGVLTRKGSAAPGGDICTYGGARGAEVTLISGFTADLHPPAAVDVVSVRTAGHRCVLRRPGPSVTPRACRRPGDASGPRACR